MGVGAGPDAGAGEGEGSGAGAGAGDGVGALFVAGTDTGEIGIALSLLLQYIKAGTGGQREYV